MRIAVVSDTHGRPWPEACLERCRAADLVLHAGDLGTEAALDALLALGPPVVAVRGNVDEPGLRARLPAEDVADADGARIAVVHDGGPAAGRLARLRKRFPAADAVVFGHSHLPLHEQADGFQLFNPGSATQRRRRPTHTMGEAQVRDGAVSFALIDLGR